jgi:CheY-like chemotaxis protein
MENKAVDISKRILVADDDPDMVAFMTLPLRKRGYTITAGGNGEEALALARQDRPDLMILDVSMPRLNGLEACERLKRDDQLKSIPVMLITATASLLPPPEILYELQVEGYLIKPFSVRVLVEKIEHLLGQ